MLGSPLFLTGSWGGEPRSFLTVTALPAIGITKLYQQFARLVHKEDKKVILVANKS